MNARNEIGGDLQDDYIAFQESEAERAEANEGAPELPEWTDEELDGYERSWEDDAAEGDAIADAANEQYFETRWEGLDD